MKILLDTALIKNPRVIALLARGALNVNIAVNEQLMRALGPRVFPPLYASHIRFQPEPWAGKLEEFAHALKVVKRGWGDCDDLVSYRIAELRVFGDRLAGTPPEKATVRIYGRGKKMHAQLRRGDAPAPRAGETDRRTIEDPSRLLGMAGRRVRVRQLKA